MKIAQRQGKAQLMTLSSLVSAGLDLRPKVFRAWSSSSIILRRRVTGMPPCDPNLSQPLGNHRSFTSRVASAAGRLRSNAQTVHVDFQVISDYPTLQELAAIDLPLAWLPFLAHDEFVRRHWYFY
jgi:hypothetical protein